MYLKNVNNSLIRIINLNKEINFKFENTTKKTLCKKKQNKIFFVILILN